MLLTVALVAGTATGTAATSGATPGDGGSPALSADPPVDLVDGQEITVHGTGFVPGSRAVVHQCEDAPVGPVDCELGAASTATVAADGTFSVSHQVFATIVPPQQVGVTDCRVAPGCVLATNLGFDGGAAAVTTALAFDPVAPTLPPPTITVSQPDGLVDGQTVTVEGQGFVHRQSYTAEPPSGPNVVSLLQCGPEGAFDGPGDPGDPGNPPGTSRSWRSNDCRNGRSHLVETDGQGDFRTELPISAMVGQFGLDFDCRTSTTDDPCLLVAYSGDGAPFGAVAEWSAAADLTFDPNADLADRPTPELSVSPDRDLQVHDVLTVEGHGFVPGATQLVNICRADDPERCAGHEYSQLPRADLDGTFRIELPATTGDRLECRSAPGCVVKAKDWERDERVTAAVAYGRPEGARGRYLDPVFSDVDIERDVVFRDTVDAAGNPVQLQMDIYQPAGDTAGRRPAVMWMHGGFFVFGDKSDMAEEATEYARRGYVAVSINYRLRSVGDYHGMFLASLDAYDDAVAAVDWLRAHASDYRLDPDTIVAGGFSAGAVTAANLAYLPGRRGPATSPVAGAVVDAGLVYTVPERGDPPVIAFHDTDDSTTPYDSVRPLCDWAQEVDAPCDLVTSVGHGHGAPSTADLVDRSTRFLAEHVLEPRGYLDAGHRCTVVGTPGDDRLVGTRRDDVLCGRGGHDVLIGRGGHDHLHGGTGDDHLRGGPGDDRLLGGPDRDRADGGPGRDTCDAETPTSCTS